MTTSTIATTASIVTEKNINARDIMICSVNFEGKSEPEFTKTLKVNNLYMSEKNGAPELVQYIGTRYSAGTGEYFCFRLMENSLKELPDGTLKTLPIAGEYFEIYINTMYLGKYIFEVDEETIVNDTIEQLTEEGSIKAFEIKVA